MSLVDRSRRGTLEGHLGPLGLDVLPGVGLPLAAGDVVGELLLLLLLGEGVD